jgi:hypothetical protein
VVDPGRRTSPTNPAPEGLVRSAPRLLNQAPHRRHPVRHRVAPGARIGRVPAEATPPAVRQCPPPPAPVPPGQARPRHDRRAPVIPVEHPRVGVGPPAHRRALEAVRGRVVRRAAAVPAVPAERAAPAAPVVQADQAAPVALPPRVVVLLVVHPGHPPAARPVAGRPGNRFGQGHVASGRLRLTRNIPAAIQVEAQRQVGCPANADPSRLNPRPMLLPETLPVRVLANDEL